MNPRHRKSRSMELTLESATKKIENLAKDFPQFKPYSAVYNRHGVAVFGQEEGSLNYSFFRASPKQEHVLKMDCYNCELDRDGGSKRARTRNGQVTFSESWEDQVHFLNCEPANPITLPKSSRRIIPYCAFSRLCDSAPSPLCV